MWEKVVLDTRRLGAMSEFMDKFVHTIPTNSFYDHMIQIDCWCEPRVVWPENGNTCVVHHRHVKPPYKATI